MAVFGFEQQIPLLGIGVVPGRNFPVKVKIQAPQHAAIHALRE